MLRTLCLLSLLSCGSTDSEDEDDGDCIDQDGDGYSNCEDCDDLNPQTYPGASEICDGQDNNCDGTITYEGNDGQECALCAENDLFYLTQATPNRADDISAASDGVSCTYSNATRYMFTALDKQSGQVECVYTGRKVDVGSEKPDPENMNTEHTWPQSQGADSLPAKCDLHHLFPTDYNANQIRAVYPLDDVVSSTSWNQGGSSLGQNASGAEVFEPRDEHKGNAARALIYFANRYGYSLTPQQWQTYTAWSTLDPIDDAEIARTSEIFRRQGNPNPFVFCPILIEQLATEQP